MDASSSTAAVLLLLAAAGSAVFLIARDAPVKRQGDARTPPVLPFAFPLIGHLAQFLWDTEKLFTKASTHYGPDTPVRLRLANRRMTILNGASNIMSLFKASRWVSSERWLVQVLLNAFGINTQDVPFYLADNTGVGQQPLPHSNSIPPEHRIFHLSYQSVHDGLSGKRLEELQEQFIRNFHEQVVLAEIDEDGAWTDVPDLYGSLLQAMTFKASVKSVCGPHILEDIPNLEADFWEYDRRMGTLLSEVPRWLSPASHASRDKMKKNIRNWHELAHKGYGTSDIETDESNWEEHFGSKLFRSRQVFLSKTPLTKDTIAAEDLGLFWASAANVIPALGWMVIEAAQRPELLERIRTEVAPFLVFPTDGGPPDIDLDGLCQQPLVQSLYAEVLRVHAGTIIARVPQKDNFSIGGWLFPKDEPIMISTYDTARTASVWNHGTPEEPHPVGDFWPERFIVDPNDPNSGPVLPHLRPEKTQGQPEKPPGPYFSLDGTTGSWLPFGGGSRMCPGRHFAKREMIVGMALFLTEFDIELDPQGGRIEHDMAYVMLGVMHPKGSVPAKVRRRRTVAR